ncbi:SRPBCC domain-containing protein [Nonomuraea sp. NPDC050790]|uniref:SRPBCC domain-containing protein n=1 Tax=Nonomuraea sp. NPDC050790 TaxID=3364371 RepID=UPI0037896B4C
MPTTQVSRLVRAPRSAVYQALLDPGAIAAWRVPEGMSSHVHTFEAREGGYFRVSLTYHSSDEEGKSGGNTDTYHGRFVQLVPDERVVEVVEFESADPAMGGEMTMTTTLADADGGTEVVILHEGLPEAVSPAANETGTRMALDNLARLLESR